ncbi:MAG: hypothetical protein U1G07_00685 [Verrucomicrobiota bacterium]
MKSALAAILLAQAAPLDLFSANAQPSPELLFRDAFEGKLAPGWSIDREDPAAWRIADHALAVRVQPGNMWGGANNARNVFVRSIPEPTDVPVEISVTISNRPTAQWEQANLVWYYDAGHMVKLGQELVTGRLSIVMGREENDRARTIAIVPLDANAVELRLQALKNQVRGQFRTAPWREWRDVGECDLPVKGSPKVSLHFYNGPPNEEHWVQVRGLTVRRPSNEEASWPRPRLEEKTLRASDQPRLEFHAIALADQLRLTGVTAPLMADADAQGELRILRYADGAFGWWWDRRKSSIKDPIAAGVDLGGTAVWPLLPKTDFAPVPLESVQTLDAELNAVTRLEDDQGDHNLVLRLALSSARRLTIWFDWYGPASDLTSVTDGYREYGRTSPSEQRSDVHYRIRGFRGAPPRIHLKPFLDDGLGSRPEGQLLGIWFGNEVWNGSRGGTQVTQFDLVINGRRYRAVARP